MSVVLYTNLLLLFVVSITSPEYINKHKRLRNVYSLQNFSLLLKMLSGAINVIVTPNTATETSNLIKFINPPARDQVCESLRALIKRPDVVEVIVESRSAVEQREFIRLGLTDAALLHAGNQSTPLLTADLDLYLATLDRGSKAENFNHYRHL